MTLGLSTAAFYGHGNTEELAAHMDAWDVDTCEVFLESFSEYSAAFGAQVRAALHGLDCISVHPMSSQFEAQLYAINARQRADALAMFEGVCEAGEALGARYYVHHGAFRMRAPQRMDAIPQLAERVGEQQEIARRHGLEMLWENVSWCALRTPEDVAYMRRVLPEQGFVLDIKQATACGVSPAEMAAAMGGGLKHLHLMDRSADGSLCLPGEGAVDWAALRETLRALHFEGAAILEPYEQQAKDAERLKRSLAFLRAWMD